MWGSLNDALGPLASAASVLEWVASGVLGTLEKPEPFGTLTLQWNADGPDQASEQSLWTTQVDTFTPSWADQPGYLAVQFNEYVRLRVVLWDEDLLNHDAIGDVTLNPQHIAEAWAAQTSYPILVHDQSAKQLLSVSLSVTESDACAGISYQGCCDDTILLFCEDGQLGSQDCVDAPFCGWDPAAGYYGCGTSGAGDPSGLYPQACPW